MSRPVVIAHRGASADAPENTLAAFRLAEAQGADAVEMDVRLSRDRVPVVIHDPTTLRTAGVEGRVAEMALEELKRLDVGRFFSAKFRGERIPTLAEVAETFPGRLFVEVKDSLRSVSTVVRALREAGALGRTTLCSFHPLVLRKSKFDAFGAVSTSLLVAEVSPNLLKRPAGWWLSGARAVAPFYTLVDAILAEARPRAVPVYPWTVDSMSIGRRMMEKGVAGVITNRPGRMVKVREELGL